MVKYVSCLRIYPPHITIRIEIVESLYGSRTRHTIRVNAGLRRRRAEGKIGCGAEIYGYRNGDDGKLTIYQPEAEIVRTIFDLCIKGSDSPAIAGYLNQRGINTPSHLSKNHKIAMWNRDAVRRILRKRAYTGQFIDGKISVKKVDGIVKKVSNPESSHVYLIIPTIIDAQTFESAQKTRPRGTKGASAGKIHLPDNRLSGEKEGKKIPH
jgi:site-specific DNA recombinase